MNKSRITILFGTIMLMRFIDISYHDLLHFRIEVVLRRSDMQWNARDITSTVFALNLNVYWAIDISNGLYRYVPTNNCAHRE